MKVVLRDLYRELAVKVGTPLPDKLLEFAKAVGVDGFDIHYPDLIPGWQGYEREKYGPFLLNVKKKLQGYGLNINSTLIPAPRALLMGLPEADEELQKFCDIIRCIGEASIPIADLDLNLDVNTFKWHRQVEQRGGYKMSAFNIRHMAEDVGEGEKDETYSPGNLWDRRVRFYREIVPVAEEYDVNLALHPPDPPVPDHMIPGRIGLLDWNNLIWETPSRCNGVKYCVGTRYESGIDVLEEIRFLVKRGKIFNVHFRNVRGALPRGGAYEEVLLDDGDMNMFKVITALHDAGYEGSLCPDHAPEFRDDEPERRIGRAYSVGYIKALISLL
jgi:mannonate dehydratase